MENKNLSIEIFNKYSGKLFVYIFGIVKNKQEAEDLLQESFLKVIQKSDTLKDQTRAESWLFTISRNTVFNYLRRKKRASGCCHENEYCCTTYSEKKNYNEELLECLPRYIEKIPFEYREALTMADIEQLPQKEIAERLNISLTAAKSRIQRGRIKLKQVLEAGCYMEFDAYGNLVTCKPYKKRTP